MTGEIIILNITCTNLLPSEVNFRHYNLNVYHTSTKDTNEYFSTVVPEGVSSGLYNPFQATTTLQIFHAQRHLLLLFFDSNTYTFIANLNTMSKIKKIYHLHLNRNVHSVTRHDDDNRQKHLEFILLQIANLDFGFIFSLSYGYSHDSIGRLSTATFDSTVEN